jgi:hypothetical protein
MKEEEIELIRSTFTYNPENGALTRLKSYHKRYISETFGTANGKGYMLVRIGKKKYNVHRLAWILHHGYNPDEVDHINHDKKDNRICNLREVSRLEQMKNRALGVNNTSGRIGVSMEKGRWKAHIGINRKRIHLGFFDTFDEACAARDSAEKVYSFHINHGIKL